MKKQYIIKVIVDDDNKLNIYRKNDGFNPYEILGFLYHASSEILDQMKGNIKPDIIKRKVVIK